MLLNGLKTCSNIPKHFFMANWRNSKVLWWLVTPQKGALVLPCNVPPRMVPRYVAGWHMASMVHFNMKMFNMHLILVKFCVFMAFGVILDHFGQKFFSIFWPFDPLLSCIYMYHDWVQGGTKCEGKPWNLSYASWKTFSTSFFVGTKHLVNGLPFGSHPRLHNKANLKNLRN